MKLKTFESLTLYRFRYVIGYALMIGLGLFLFLFRLGSLTPALSASELASTRSSHIRQVIKDPINAPYRLLQATTHKLMGDHIWAIRLPSVAFGILTLLGVYLFLRYAYTERVAVMGTLLSGIGATLLIFGRLGTPDIASAAALALLLGVSTWVMAAENIRRRHLIALAFTAGLALYTPLGVVWLLTLLIIHPKELRRTISNASNIWLSVAVVIFLLALAPIVYAAVQQPHILRFWIWWPAHLPRWRSMAWDLLRLPAAVFWRDTFSDPVTHLGNLPLIDIFTSAMVILGSLTLLFKPTLARTRILLIVGMVGFIANAINPIPAHIVILFPVIGILAAIGLERMLEEWYDTFPRNPFARVGALVPLALIFGLTIFYHVHRSFVAWPKNPDTKAYYQQHLP